jgi:predicted alpha/beta hydrolase family esterase
MTADASMLNRHRVLFIHGLESGPQGPKVLALQAAGFDVAADFMHMSVMRLNRRNSVVRQLLRLPELRGLALLTALGLALPPWTPWQRLSCLSASGLWLGARRHRLREQAVQRSFDACLEIQRKALRRHRPEVLVGSSWGGAVAAELLLQGEHQGPAILLAPAIHRVERARGHDPHSKVQQLQHLSEHQRVVVFHDPSDDTVPFADSSALCSSGAIELKSVDAGGHRLLELLDDGRLAGCVSALASAFQKAGHNEDEDRQSAAIKPKIL